MNYLYKNKTLNLFKTWALFTGFLGFVIAIGFIFARTFSRYIVLIILSPILILMFVSHPWINPNTIEDRDYQKNIVKTAVSGNTLCVIPTGLGKTSIAALVAADCLQKDMNKKILFLAPTKPLVNQHKKTFEKFMKIGEDELKAITGEDKPELRANIYKKADIVFATPQTIRNDLKANILSLKDFSLVIFDEAHRAIGEYAYPYIAKVYKYHCKNP